MRSSLRRAAALATGVTVAVGWSVGASPATAVKPGVTLVSADRSGTAAGTEEFGRPAMDRTGRYVLFSSPVDGIVPGDDDGAWDLFRKDLATGKVEAVSEGVPGPTWRGDLSGDGRFAAFHGDGTYLRDIAAGTTVVVDEGPRAVAAGPAVSDDGSVVAFTDVNTGLHVADLDAGTMLRLGPADTVDLTPDGRWLVLSTRDDTTSRIVRVDLATGDRTTLYEGPSGAGVGAVMPFADADASVVAFTVFSARFSEAQAMVWRDGVLTRIGAEGALSAATPPSDDGTRLLVMNARDPTALIADVDLVDLAAGTTATVASTSAAWGNSITRDGRAMAWTTTEPLVAGDVNDVADLYASRLPRR